MATESDRIRADIERTRGELADNVSMLADRTNPKRIVERRWDAVKDRAGTAFGTIRSYLQAKVALYQQEGGILKRVLATGGTVYADVVSGGIDLSGGWLQAHKDADVESTIAFEAGRPWMRIAPL